jgi:hypothetical protein
VVLTQGFAPRVIADFAIIDHQWAGIEGFRLGGLNDPLNVPVQLTTSRLSAALTALVTKYCGTMKWV